MIEITRDYPLYRLKKAETKAVERLWQLRKIEKIKRSSGNRSTNLLYCDLGGDIQLIIGGNFYACSLIKILPEGTAYILPLRMYGFKIGLGIQVSVLSGGAFVAYLKDFNYKKFLTNKSYSLESDLKVILGTKVRWFTRGGNHSGKDLVFESGIGLNLASLNIQKVQSPQEWRLIKLTGFNNW